jgi:hypothetical protein
MSSVPDRVGSAAALSLTRFSRVLSRAAVSEKTRLHDEI